MLSVVVHDHLADETLQSQRAVVKHNRRLARRVLIPVLVVAWVAWVLAAVEAVHHDSSAGLIALGTIAVIAVWTWILLWLQKRRINHFPGRLWSSSYGVYLGPHDDGSGMVGARQFALAHRGEGTLPPSVRLLMTEEGFELVSANGKDTLRCPFTELARLDITPRTEGVPAGVSFTTHDGRTAALLVRTDRSLIDLLLERGSTVTHV